MTFIAVPSVPSQSTWHNAESQIKGSGLKDSGIICLWMLHRLKSPYILELITRQIGWLSTTVTRIMDNKISKSTIFINSKIHIFHIFVFTEDKIALVIDDTFFNCCESDSSYDVVVISWFCINLGIIPSVMIHNRISLLLHSTNHLRKEWVLLVLCEKLPLKYSDMFKKTQLQS